jgi:broad specificity phosphatase PhoE
MNRPALLVLVRHGQSERNIVKKRNHFYLDEESRKAVKGIPDHRIALTAEGHRQAVETGRELRNRFGAFDYVFHSGYTRAIQTAEGILAAYPPEDRAAMIVRHHLFIRERDGGHTYDMTDAEATAAFPWLQDYWSTFGPFFARPPGGESLAQVCERAYAFLQKVGRTMAGKRVLVVSHAGTMWCLRYVLEGWSYDEADRRFNTEPMPNCAVTSYTLEPPSSRLRLGEASQVFWTKR